MRQSLISGPVLVIVGLQFGSVMTAVAAANPQQDGSGPNVAASALWVEVLEGPVALEPEAIRIAIERELGLPTQASSDRPYAGRVSVEGVAGPAVIVRYESKDATTKLERRLALPFDPARRPLVISWVVGNLVRNEAAEILSGMKGRGSSQAIEYEAAAESGTEVEQTGPSLAEAAPTVKAQATKSPKSAEPTASARSKTQVTTNASAPPAEPDLGPSRVIHLALFSPKIALDQDSDQHRYRLSFGAVYSRIGALSGLGLTWFVDRVDTRMTGAQFSGIWSHSKHSRGVLIAGVGTSASGDLEGAELAGVVTLRQGCVFGAQLSGVWAMARNRCKLLQPDKRELDTKTLVGIQVGGVGSYVDGGFRGVQLAGALTMATDYSEGAQLSGGLNLAQDLSAIQFGFVNVGRDIDGLQLAGAANLSRDIAGAQLGVVNVGRDIKGLQLSGSVNVSRDVRGMQLGVVNVGRDVDGLQLGIVNVARENRGLALGLFNWAKGVRIQPTYFFETHRLHSVGFKTISGHATSSVSFGYDPSRDIARTHFAFGVRTSLGRFAVGAETGYGWVLERFSTGPSDRAHELDLIGTVTLEILRNWLSVYGGGGVAMPVSGVVPIEPRGLAQAGISLF
jgi:hypothetical protein